MKKITILLCLLMLTPSKAFSNDIEILCKEKYASIQKENKKARKIKNCIKKEEKKIKKDKKNFKRKYNKLKKKANKPNSQKSKDKLEIFLKEEIKEKNSNLKDKERLLEDFENEKILTKRNEEDNLNWKNGNYTSNMTGEVITREKFTTSKSKEDFTELKTSFKETVTDNDNNIVQESSSEDHYLNSTNKNKSVDKGKNKIIIHNKDEKTPTLVLETKVDENGVSDILYRAKTEEDFDVNKFKDENDPIWNQELDILK